jgi:hypothetical protein
MGALFKSPHARSNPIYPANCCNCAGVPAAPKINAQTKQTPQAISTCGVCSFFCPTSGRTLVMGFHPLFSLDFGAEVRVFMPGLGSALGEARPHFRWSLFHNFMDLLFAGFACREEE